MLNGLRMAGRALDASRQLLKTIKDESALLKKGSEIHRILVELNERLGAITGLGNGETILKDITIEMVGVGLAMTETFVESYEPGGAVHEMVTKLKGFVQSIDAFEERIDAVEDASQKNELRAILEHIRRTSDNLQAIDQRGVMREIGKVGGLVRESSWALKNISTIDGSVSLRIDESASKIKVVLLR